MRELFIVFLCSYALCIIGFAGIARFGFHGQLGKTFEVITLTSMASATLAWGSWLFGNAWRGLMYLANVSS